MSKDSGLNERERAILAGLAEKAAAEDPMLASRLRGGGRLDRLRLPEVPAFVHHWACGAICAVVGLAVTVLGVATSVVLGVVGLLFTLVGAYLAVTAIARGIHERTGEPDEPAGTH